MNLRILIPVKPLREGKSRLAPALGSECRAALCEQFLRNTLALGIAVAPTTIVTPDSRAAAIARSAGAKALLEPISLGLNAALDWARTQIGNAEGLLVMPTDLPLLSLAVLQSIGVDSGRITIATDRCGLGTNLLFLPHEAIRGFRFAFGEGSAVAHQREAARMRFPVEAIVLAGAALDIDSPDDYREYLSSRAVGDLKDEKQLFRMAEREHPVLNVDRKRRCAQGFHRLGGL